MAMMRCSVSMMPKKKATSACCSTCMFGKALLSFVALNGMHGPMCSKASRSPAWVRGSVRPLPTARPAKLNKGAPMSIARFGSALLSVNAAILLCRWPCAASTCSTKCPARIAT
jgi:hypothetical protein